MYSAVTFNFFVHLHKYTDTWFDVVWQQNIICVENICSSYSTYSA